MDCVVFSSDWNYMEEFPDYDSAQKNLIKQSRKDPSQDYYLQSKYDPSGVPAVPNTYEEIMRDGSYTSQGVNKSLDLRPVARRLIRALGSEPLSKSAVVRVMRKGKWADIVAGIWRDASFEDRLNFLKRGSRMSDASISELADVFEQDAYSTNLWMMDTAPREYAVDGMDLLGLLPDDEDY